MPNQYYETITQLENRKVCRDYIVGWACGYLGSPKKEEQRLTDGYEAGYADGQGKTTDAAHQWVEK